MARPTSPTTTSCLLLPFFLAPRPAEPSWRGARRLFFQWVFVILDGRLDLWRGIRSTLLDKGRHKYVVYTVAIACSSLSAFCGHSHLPRSASTLPNLPKGATFEHSLILELQNLVLSFKFGAAALISLFQDLRPMPPTQTGGCRATRLEQTWTSQTNVRARTEAIK